MAKQGGPVFINRTYGNISFYIREGIGLVRTKSNLTAKRFKTDPVFKNSRQSAGNFGLANKMASTCYKTITRNLRKKEQFQTLRNLAIELFRSGTTISEIEKEMQLAAETLQHNLENKPGAQLFPKQRTAKKAKPVRQKKPANTPQTKKRLTPPNLFVIPSITRRRHITHVRRRNPCRAALTAAAPQ